jgi:uncharacterized protein (DUF1499 family)
MTDYSASIVSPLARWAWRLALFSACLLLTGLVLHRLANFPTKVAMNLFAVSYAGASLAILTGLVALVRIWRTGFGGAGLATFGILLPLATFAGPAFYVAAYHDLPRINDVTTDFASPPAFVALAKRAEGANSSAYPGASFSEQQAKAYPDLRTLVLDRSVEEAFELVEETARRLRWRVAAAEPPTGKPSKTGRLEATDQTLLVGFTDDIVVRIDGGPARARVDVRSASRYGTFDFGQNAARVRRFIAELHARAEATGGPGLTGRRALSSARARALLKRQKSDDPQQGANRNVRGPAPSSAQRAPGQKERPR